MDTIEVSRQRLDEAVGAGVLDNESAARLWTFLRVAGPSSESTPRFTMAHVLFYLGGLIAIGAISLFVNTAWEAFGAWPLLFFALGGMLVGYLLARRFAEVERQPIAAGTMAALFVAAVPLFVFALQHVLGAWPDESSIGSSYSNYHRYVDWRWLMMELATIVAGVGILWRFGLPFAMMPIAVTLWYMSMDFAPLLANALDASLFDVRANVSLVFGLAIVLVAVGIEMIQYAPSRRQPDRRDFAFWLYLVGVLTFWGGVSSLGSETAIGRAIYGLVNTAMILFGAAVARRVFAVFGGLGVFVLMLDLSRRMFADSLLFPVAVAFLGLAVVFLGIVWSRREAVWNRRLSALLPAPLRRAVEARTPR